MMRSVFRGFSSSVFTKAVVAIGVFALTAQCQRDRVESGPVTEEDVAARIGSIVIVGPFGAEPVTGETGVLYFSMLNSGPDADTLLRAVVDLARDVTLHNQTSSSGTDMQMVPVSHIVVPPGEAVSLRPGGLHVMLRDLRQWYRAGDSLIVTLDFARGGSGTFLAPVIPYADVLEHSGH